VQRTIDLGLEELAQIDEHGVLVLAPREEVWEALVRTVPGAFSGRATARVATALGCAETEVSGEPGRIGSTFPGFVVTRVIEPAALALMGRHRFSHYGLVFSLEATKDEQTLLRAETRANFPGLKGKIYRTAVIGTHGHVVVVKRLLNAVKRRAEKGAGKG
jgi:hypothetical protein